MSNLNNFSYFLNQIDPLNEKRGKTNISLPTRTSPHSRAKKQTNTYLTFKIVITVMWLARPSLWLKGKPQTVRL